MTILEEWNAETENLEQLVADLAEALDQAVDDVREARSVARDLWDAMAELRLRWVAEDDMLHAWNRVYTRLPEYLRKWLRDSA